MVRKAMLEQGMNSMGNMFGSIGTGGLNDLLPKSDRVVDAEFIPEENTENPAFQSENRYSEEQPVEQNKKTTPPTKATEGEDNLFCAVCNAKITNNVYEFSMNKHGNPLCVMCQKGVGK